MAEFDPLAEHYDLTRGGEPRRDQYASEFDAILPAGDGVVLEIGVGTGVVALGLARRKRRVVGIDVSGSMLEFAWHRLGPVVVRGDATRLPFASGSVSHAVAVARERVTRSQPEGRPFRAVRPGRIIGVALCVSLLACDGQRTSEPPISTRLPPALRAAIRQTLAVKSVRAETTGSARVTAVYQAPDRALRIQTPPAELAVATPGMTFTQTYIGDVMYNQVPNHPTIQTKLAKGMSGHVAALNQVMQPILVLASADKATATGNTYAFSAVIHTHQPGATNLTEAGTAVVQDGFIVRIDTTTTGVPGSQAVTVFDEFNTAPSVDPPAQ